MSQPAPVADDAALNPHTGLSEPSNAKLQQLAALHAEHAKGAPAGAKCPYLQLQNGLFYRDDDNSLKVGVRGPTLLEDQVLREKIQHFDHERIPERVVHARGTGAHGHFRCYESLADLTSASVFSAANKTTPVFVRFSTVLGSRGSADTPRDVRGFAVKFYSDSGNWDLVGNNIPVFFIQDAMKFPDMVHAGKPEPQTEMPQAATAHDNFWDFCSWSPETMHMLCWAMSDRTLPRNFRTMQGFGVHTFLFVNAAGKRTFVKFHWKPKLGLAGMAWDESLKLIGADPDFQRRDLYENISKGNFPQWELGVQCVKEEDEESFDFDILDSTKLIPEDLVPVRYIGEMTLDRVPADFFAEVEQVAFCTANIIPGIDFSHDPLLQGRNFSYLDTQLSRLGSVNFNQIPINRPLHFPPQNNQRDGHMQMNIPTGQPRMCMHAAEPSHRQSSAHFMCVHVAVGCQDKFNYFPSRGSAAGTSARPGNGGETQSALLAQKADSFASYAQSVHGMKLRAKAPKFMERFDQASLFFNSQTAAEQRHMLAAASFELSKVDDVGVRTRMVALWNEVDHGFATKLATHIAVDAPGPPQHANHGRRSEFLSMVEGPYAPGASCATKKVACPVADGYRAEEMAALKAALEKEGAELVVIGPRRGLIFSAGAKRPEKGAGSQPDPAKDKPDPSCKQVNTGFTFDNCKSVVFDGVALIGGEASVATLEQTGAVSAFLCETLKHCKPVCASGDALRLIAYPTGVAGIALAKSGSADAVADDGVISSAAASPGAEHAAKFIDALKKHRAWDRKGLEKIPA